MGQKVQKFPCPHTCSPFLATNSTTIGAFTLTCHHSKSLDVRALSWCFTFSGFGQMCNDMCLPVHHFSGALLSFIILYSLFLAVLRLHCCTGFFLVVLIRGYSLDAVHEVLIACASLVVEHRL